MADSIQRHPDRPTSAPPPASEFDHQGERVVHGQRLMQASSDFMLGWVRAEGIDGNSDVFDLAMAGFAEAYADQSERDYGALRAAVADGRVEAITEPA